MKSKKIILGTMVAFEYFLGGYILAFLLDLQAFYWSLKCTGVVVLKSILIVFLICFFVLILLFLFFLWEDLGGNRCYIE